MDYRGHVPATPGIHDVDILAIHDHDHFFPPAFSHGMASHDPIRSRLLGNVPKVPSHAALPGSAAETLEISAYNIGASIQSMTTGAYSNGSLPSLHIPKEASWSQQHAQANLLRSTIAASSSGAEPYGSYAAPSSDAFNPTSAAALAAGISAAAKLSSLAAPPSSQPTSALQSLLDMYYSTQNASSIPLSQPMQQQQQQQQQQQHIMVPQPPPRQPGHAFQPYSSQTQHQQHQKHQHHQQHLSNNTISQPPVSLPSIFENITMQDVDRLREIVRANNGTLDTSSMQHDAWAAGNHSSRGYHQSSSRPASGGSGGYSGRPAGGPAGQHEMYDYSHGEQHHGEHHGMTSQEKNRAAQRRFRMRQKAKIASFEQQVEELSEQLKQAHTECASLKNLNTILEQVLNLRDEHINGLQQAAHVLSPNSAKRPASEISSESDSLAADPPGDMPEVTSGDEHFPDGPLPHASKLPTDKFKAMSFEEALGTYKGYLTRIAANMAALEEQHRGGARSEVVATLLELGGFIERICMLRPRDLWRFCSSDLGTGQRAAAVPEGHWELVLQQLRLSPEQKAALLAERSRMLVRLSAILVERQKLAQELAAAAVVPGDDYLQLTSAALQSHGVQEALTANVLREHNCYTEFGIFFFKKVLTLVQNAKCWLHAYPYYPDRMAMANLIAAEAGLPSSKEPIAAARAAAAAQPAGQGAAASAAAGEQQGAASGSGAAGISLAGLAGGAMSSGCGVGLACHGALPVKLEA